MMTDESRLWTAAEIADILELKWDGRVRSVASVMRILRKDKKIESQIEIIINKNGTEKKVEPLRWKLALNG